ncbi:MAG: LysR substrate-binding domain-containing protein [Bdellovibrio sp.]
MRASRGLIATKRALQLEKPVMDLLAQLDEVLVGPVDFNPLKAQNIFRIATTDYFEQVALPKILQILEKEAPDITIISRPTFGSLPKTELENGEYDMAIAGFFGDLPEGYMKQKLFEDDFVCVSRNDHPRIKRKTLTPEQYSKEKHLLISVQGDLKTKSKDLLAKQGLQQDFRAGVSSFLSPGWILTTTNYLLTCPRKLAHSYEKHLPVSLHELPFEIPKIQVVQVWHQKHHRDPAHSWLRHLIHQVSQTL